MDHHLTTAIIERCKKLQCHLFELCSTIGQESKLLTGGGPKLRCRGSRTSSILWSIDLPHSGVRRWWVRCLEQKLTIGKHRRPLPARMQAPVSHPPTTTISTVHPGWLDRAKSWDLRVDMRRRQKEAPQVRRIVPFFALRAERGISTLGDSNTLLAGNHTGEKEGIHRSETNIIHQELLSTSFRSELCYVIYLKPTSVGFINN